MNMIRKSACALLVFASSGTIAQAQVAPPPQTTSENGGVQDIVVTARRQSEGLQQTPIAITALTGAAMERLDVQQIDKIAQITPNLVISQQSSGLSSATITMRGIGQTDPSFALDSAVGVYLDGIYVARTAGSLFDLIDVERIEVLRGPQGTLFGRNTTGGAIQIISRKPDNDFGMQVRGGYGSRDNWFGRARIDTGNFGDTPISAAFSYYHRERDGWFDNLLTPDNKDPGSLRVDAVSAALRGDFDAFRFDYAYDYDNRTGAPGFFQTVALSPDALRFYSRSASLGGAPLQYNPVGRTKSGLQQPGFANDFTSRTVSQGHSLALSYDLAPNVTIKSLTGFRQLRLENVLGLSGNGDLKGLVLNPSTGGVSIQSVTPYNGFNSPQKQKQFSEELQLNGTVGDFTFSTGLYYFRERGSEDNNQKLTVVLPGGNVGLNLAPVQSYNAISKSAAVYGQLSWRPASLDGRLELTGGLRYTVDRRSILLLNSSNGVSTVIGTPRGEVKYKDTSFLGSASYRFTPDVLGYAKVSTGYKAGGFNPRAGRINTFEPEKLTSYEVGLKADMLDRRVRANVAAFFSRYRDLQVSQFASGSSGATTLLVNAGSADYKGVEVELTVVPTRGLTITGTVGYVDPQYKEFLFLNPTTNVVTDIADTARYPNVAKVNANLAAEYFFPQTDHGQVQARLAYAYRSQVYFHPNDAVNPFQESVFSPATNTVSARVALSQVPLGSRAKGEIAILGDNLLNEDQVLYGIDFGGLGFGGRLFAEPRRVSIEFKLSY